MPGAKARGEVSFLIGDYGRYFKSQEHVGYVLKKADTAPGP